MIYLELFLTFLQIGAFSFGGGYGMISLIRHFVSDDNEDITDPANKFYQAVRKLVEWNKTQNLKTIGIKEFEKICKEQSYPGLGVVKKLSLMHHLELIGDYLDGEKV